MKIKINDNEYYNIEIEQEIEIDTLNGLIERLRTISKLGDYAQILKTNVKTRNKNNKKEGLITFLKNNKKLFLELHDIFNNYKFEPRKEKIREFLKKYGYSNYSQKQVSNCYYWLKIEFNIKSREYHKRKKEEKSL